MVRRHFMTGEKISKPDYIITYYAPKHVPFFGGYAKDDVYGMISYGAGFTEEYVKFKVISDKWVNGVGEWLFKLEDPTHQVYTGAIFGRPINQNNDILIEIATCGFGTADTFGKVTLDENGNAIHNEEINNSNIITSVIFGEGVKTINGSILAIDSTNTSCTEITLPESVLQLTGYLFSNYDSLKSITVPSNVVRIDNLCCVSGNNGGYSNEALEEVILKPLTPPDASNALHDKPLGSYYPEYTKETMKIRVYADCIDTYKNDAVWGQYSDLYDTINNAIVYYTEDGSRKIYEQTDDITIIPDTATDVRLDAIYMYLPDSVTTLSLNYYLHLKEFTIPNGVTTLLEGSIENCYDLEKLTINDNIINAEFNSILYCRNINTIFFNNNNIRLSPTVVNSTDKLKCVIIGDNVTLLLPASFLELSNLQEVILPNTITIIPNLCFLSCTSLQTIQIPDSVTSIGNAAFMYCQSLTSITIPNSVTSIVEGAFSYCSSLTSITFQGTMAQWTGINLGSNWKLSVPATVVHCTDGDVEI